VVAWFGMPVGLVGEVESGGGDKSVRVKSIRV
jgi:hypothetical protein